MSFSGLHVVCGYAGGRGFSNTTQPLIRNLIWSEDPASVTTNIAAPFNDYYGEPLFRIRAAADSWVSIGKSPDATSGKRVLVSANTDIDVFVDPGDKLAWVAA